jgi:glycosyltransferase involved in cell wall biosynthesis
MRRKPANAPASKIVAYYPTDAGPIKKEWVDMLNGFDAQVCYSHYAEDVMTASNGGKRPSNLHQIYHGVDRQVYQPINQQAARLACNIPLDKFVIGMVARNQPRKRFDILCKAFAEFAKDKPETMLYLHTAKVDVGWDIDEMVGQLGLKNRVYVTEVANPVKGVSDQEMNVIYNTFDINALISLGDGFGLPVAESMAVQCPQVVSDHSCLKELVEGHGGLTVKNAAWVMNTNGINTWGGLTDVDDLVAKFNLLYGNFELRMKLAENGYNFISQEHFTWNYAADKFNELFRSLFHILERSVPNGTDKRVAYASAT